jgi:hypothetical protein
MLKQGRPLSASERAIFKPYFATLVLDSARIVEDYVPFWLRRNMCAVVLGHRIFLRPGAYHANTLQGIALLGHELTHVSQFLHGMTIMRYLWSCRYGYRHSHYEIEAYAKGHFIAKDASPDYHESASMA